MRRSPWLLILLLVLSAPAAAQPAVTRLSPLEAVTRSLAPGIAVQAADREGAWTYVAWGTYDGRAEGEGAPALLLSVVDETGAAPARLVHSEAGRPSRLVRVVAGTDGATVIWYDRRRDAPGLYARRFDTDGEPLGDERRIVAGDASDLTIPPQHPMLTIALVHGMEPLVLDAVGDVLARTHDALRLPHMLRADSSLVTIAGVRIEQRRHYLDDSTASSVTVSIAGELDATARVLSAAPDERPWLYFLERADAPAPTCFGDVWAGARLRRGLVATDGSLTAIETIDTFNTCNSGLAAIDARVRDVRRHRLGGGFAITFELERTRRSESGDTLTFVDNVAIGIGPRGEYVRRTPRSDEWNGGRAELTRVTSDSLSVVRLEDGWELAAPIVAAPAGVSQGDPAYDRASGDLVAWREADGGTRRYILHAVSSDVAALDTLVLLDSAWSRVTELSTIVGEQRSLWSGSSLRPLVGSLEWQWAYTTSTGNGSTASSAGVWAAGADGWRRIIARTHAGPRNSAGGEYSIAAMGSGLDRSAVVLLDDRAGRAAVRLDGPSEAIDSIRSASRAPVSATSPIDRTHWALIAGDTVRVAQPDLVAPPFVVAGPEGETIWHKPSEGRLLRATLASDSGRLELVIVDRFGAIRARGSAAVSAGSRQPALIAADAQIAILFESPRGIELVRFDPTLAVSRVDLVVTSRHDSVAHLVGRIIDEGLFVAWEEVREGVSDVFGASIYIGPLSVPEPDAPARRDGRSVRPGDRFVMELPDAVDGDMATLLDMRGSIVRHVDVIGDDVSRHAVIDTGDLSSGYYRLVVRSRHCLSSYGITIAH